MSAVGRSRERGRYRDRGQLKQPILWRVTSAHLDDGNDRAILVQGDEGPAQVVRLGHQGTPSVTCLQRRWCHLLAACPIPSRRRREKGSNPRSHSSRLSPINRFWVRAVTAAKSI